MTPTNAFYLNELQLEAFPISGSHALKIRVGTSSDEIDNITLSGNIWKMFLRKQQDGKYRLDYSSSSVPGTGEYLQYAVFFFKSIDDSSDERIPEFKATHVKNYNSIDYAGFVIGTDDERIARAIYGSAHWLMEKIEDIDHQPYVIIRTTAGTNGSIEVWHFSHAIEK